MDESQTRLSRPLSEMAKSNSKKKSKRPSEFERAKAGLFIAGAKTNTRPTDKKETAMNQETTNVRDRLPTDSRLPETAKALLGIMSENKMSDAVILAASNNELTEAIRLQLRYQAEVHDNHQKEHTLPREMLKAAAISGVVATVVFGIGALVQIFTRAPDPTAAAAVKK
jgi:hypothetical protein